MAVFLLLLVLGLDVFLIRMEREHYWEKMSILVQMAEAKGDMDTAAELLKENRAGDLEGSILASYGYSLESGNHYQSVYQRNVRGILAVSGLAYALILGILFLERKKERRDWLETVNELAEIVSRFRQGDYTLHRSGISEGNGSLLMELESLGNALDIREEENRSEKEGVKSLVTDISHQLKTPVAALKAGLEILKQPDLSEEEREEFLGRCHQQVRGLELLLSSLISISRMESGMIEIRLEEANIFETIVNAVNRVYVKAEEKGIDIVLEAQEELQNLSVPHDKKWLCEALINLLENAVKYSPGGTQITIRMLPGIHFLRVEIEDEGIGIPKSEYHKIFQRFYRGQSKSVKEQEGSGVGLYLAREIIDRHQGTIAVHAREKFQGGEGGSVFVMQLPYSAQLPEKDC